MMLRRTVLSTVRTLAEGVQSQTLVARSFATSRAEGTSDENSRTPASQVKEHEAEPTKESLLSESSAEAVGARKEKQKTIAELDEELRLKLEGISGEGGGAGVEYEGGKAEGLKRGVKANMFRVI